MISDNQMVQAFLPLITAGLETAGYDGVMVLQDYQPTMQGTFFGPAVYFFKVNDNRYGFLGREDYWDDLTAQEVHTETQYRESTWQFSALVTVDPSNLSAYTSSDLANQVAQILASDSSRLAMQALGFGTYRITDVRNPFFINEQDRYQAFPSFDMTMTYQDVTISYSNIITPPINPVIEGI